ncbi:MAG: hypothetical protein ORN54_11245 [Cyclobacteriaceae bacterium]|nr:hypothetical protein [Cyclobacteriaceae bacterium]
MKTRILTFLVAAISINVCVAQDETQKMKNDIGFNTNIVFNGVLNSSGGPFVFMYKHQLDGNKALRYGLSLNLNLSSSNNGSDQSFFFVNPSFGKEWQSTLSKRWIWYRGVDIRGTINQSNFSNNFNGNQLNEQERLSYGVSFSPLMGVRFAITNRLYVATEANFNIGYTFEKNTTRSFVNGNQTSINEFSNNRFNVGTVSAFGIFIFYRL